MLLASTDGNIEFSVAHVMLEVGLPRPGAMANIIYIKNSKQNIAVLVQMQPTIPSSSADATKAEVKNGELLVPRQLAARILNLTGPVRPIRIDETPGVPKKLSTSSATGRVLQATTESPFTTVLSLASLSSTTPTSLVIDSLTSVQGTLARDVEIQINYIMIGGTAIATDVRPTLSAITPKKLTSPSEHGGSAQAQPPEREFNRPANEGQRTYALFLEAKNAIDAKNWQAAIPPLKELAASDPNNWQYESTLGDVYVYTAQFDQALESYRKGIEKVERINPEDANNPLSDPAQKNAAIATMLTKQGNAYLKLHKNKEAVDAYTNAASLDPNPSVAYFNLCATQYNTGDVEGALNACDKAIAADPNKADAYFIKGSLLAAGSKTDSNGKLTAPPGTAEALNKYLELQPDGPHANDVKQMLSYIGSRVETTYKKKGK
jgi:tetratricopeptide (TPR) repeat protein